MLDFRIEDSRFAKDADRNRAIEAAEKKAAELGLTDDEVLQGYAEYSLAWEQIESAALKACFAGWVEPDHDAYLSVSR
jgi:hypothetical protein